MELLEALLAQLYSGATRKNLVRALVLAVVLIFAAVVFYVFAAGLPPAK